MPDLPSGELTFCHGKSPFLMGKSTISMAIFNCYVSSPEGIDFISETLGMSLCQLSGEHHRDEQRLYLLYRAWRPHRRSQEDGQQLRPAAKIPIEACGN